MPNFSSLAGLEVPENFVVLGGRGWWVPSKWLLCLTSTKLLLSCFECSYVGVLQFSRCSRRLRLDL